jgi:TonB family protein
MSKRLVVKPIKFKNMKNGIATLVLVLFCITGFSKNYKFEYSGRFTPLVEKDKLNEVNLVSEITPELWQKLQLPYNERQELDLRRKTDFTQGYIINPKDYNYNKIVDYVSVVILALNNGKVVSSQSTGNQLTQEQKQILRTADIGADIDIKINFKFKNQADKGVGLENKINEGNLTITVVPETEAEYPGGFAQLSDYFNKNVFNKISIESGADKILNASVKFTINEDGRITNTKMSKSSTDPQIDKLILDQTSKMPKWNPARNSEGVKIKQEYSIPFGGPGC